MPQNRNYPPLAFGPLKDELSGARPEHYVNVGKVLVGWAKDRSTWPASVADFEKQLHVTRQETPGGKFWLYVPPAYTKITLCQAGDGGGSANLSYSGTLETGALAAEKDSHMATLNGSIVGGPEFILRLPPASQVAESEDRAAAGDYGLPPLYQNLSAAMLTLANGEVLPVLYARIADYTMRGCR